MKKSITKGLIGVKKGFFDILNDDDIFTVFPKILLGKNVTDECKISKWQTTSDAENGGISQCTFTANDSLHFKGKVVFDESIAEKLKIRSGYCGVRGTFEDTINLSDYEGIEISMKSNVPMVLTVNMRCESYFESDIYQYHFQVYDTWRKYHIPFYDFILTNQGMDSLMQRENDSLRTKSIGLLVRQPNVPFELEISEITALHKLTDRNVAKLAKARFTVPEKVPVEDGGSIDAGASGVVSAAADNEGNDKTTGGK